jgi:hypothetical protein
MSETKINKSKIKDPLIQNIYSESAIWLWWEDNMDAYLGSIQNKCKKTMLLLELY